MITMVTTLLPTEVDGRRQNWGSVGCRTQGWVELGSRGGGGSEGAVRAEGSRRVTVVSIFRAGSVGP